VNSGSRTTSDDRPGTIAVVVLIALLAGLAASLLATTLVVIRAIGLWRQARHTSGVFAQELSAFDERAARTERHLAEWERSSAELDLALERLRVSRARLQVLRDAMESAQGRVRWLRVFLPA
jgi:hypothetical protein